MNAQQLIGYLRREDAARYLGIAPRTLSTWQKRRLIPYIKVSHRVCLFKREDLDKALDRFMTKAV